MIFDKVRPSEKASRSSEEPVKLAGDVRRSETEGGSKALDVYRERKELIECRRSVTLEEVENRLEPP